MMGRTKAKHPRVAVLPHVEKQPKIAAIHDEDGPISWRVGDMDLDGPWSWGAILAADVEDVRRNLSEIERLTWGVACSGWRPRVKAIRTSQMPSRTRKRLLDTSRDDTDFLHEIHVSGEQRVWGIRRGSVFSLLWWDPRHTVYPSTKKNT